MVVGHAGLSDLAPAIRKARERLSRDVNTTVVSPEEFAAKAEHKGFIKTVLDKPKLFVVGDADVVQLVLSRSRLESSQPRRAS
jgi:hypothetical protein